MTFSELNGMTVLQLRKLARENSVVLGAGIDKAGIIEKLLSVLSGDTETASNTNTVAEEASQSEPKYQAAWHNAESPRFNAFCKIYFCLINSYAFLFCSRSPYRCFR